MSLPQITIVGNLAADPEMRTTQNGSMVATFTVIATSRRKDQMGNWVDGDRSGKRCTAWNQLAEHVAASLHKGDQVIVIGHERDQQWQDQTGATRYGTDVMVAEVGASLRWAGVQIMKQQQNAPSWGAPQAQPAAQQTTQSARGFGSVASYPPSTTPAPVSTNNAHSTATASTASVKGVQPMQDPWEDDPNDPQF